MGISSRPSRPSLASHAGSWPESLIQKFSTFAVGSCIFPRIVVIYGEEYLCSSGVKDEAGETEAA